MPSGEADDWHWRGWLCSSRTSRATDTVLSLSKPTVDPRKGSDHVRPLRGLGEGSPLEQHRGNRLATTGCCARELFKKQSHTYPRLAWNSLCGRREPWTLFLPSVQDFRCVPPYLVCWLVFVYLTQSRVTWDEGTSVEEFPQIGLSACLWDIFWIAH